MFHIFSAHAVGPAAVHRLKILRSQQAFGVQRADDLRDRRQGQAKPVLPCPMLSAVSGHVLRRAEGHAPQHGRGFLEKVLLAALCQLLPAVLQMGDLLIHFFLHMGGEIRPGLFFQFQILPCLEQIRPGRGKVIVHRVGQAVFFRFLPGKETVSLRLAEVLADKQGIDGRLSAFHFPHDVPLAHPLR